MGWKGKHPCLPSLMWKILSSGFWDPWVSPLLGASSPLLKVQSLQNKKKHLEKVPWLLPWHPQNMGHSDLATIHAQCRSFVLTYPLKYNGETCHSSLSNRNTQSCGGRSSSQENENLYTTKRYALNHREPFFVLLSPNKQITSLPNKYSRDIGPTDVFSSWIN